MPRQATRSAARGPLDKLRGPVRKMAEEVFSVDSDRAVLKDEPLLNGLSELQTKQALKVLDTYCANVQRQGSGRIQNKAAYLMSLIQSYKLGPASGTPGAAQRLIERLSPPVRRAVEGVFDPVLDRVVLEDRALMELLAKVPEEQAMAALKKYRATVQRRGRDAIDNRCGYLIGFLKQYQDGVAVVGAPGNAVHASRNTSSLTSNGDSLSPPKSSTIQPPSASNSHHSMANSLRHGANGVGGMSSSAMLSSLAPTTATGNGIGNTGNGVRPITYLQAPVRKQLEKLFESGKDKAVLEDVGLIKQLARLGEEQALAALKNYKEASKHRRDIHNKSAYLMGILRGYIEGTTPISKAPWEGAASDDVSSVTSTSITPVPSQGATGPAGGKTRAHGGDPSPSGDDALRNGSNSMSDVPGPLPSQLPQPAQPPAPAAAAAAPSLDVPDRRELGGFANAPAQQQQQQQQQQRTIQQPPQSQQPPPDAIPASPAPVLATAQNASLPSPPNGSGGLFLGGIGHGAVSAESSQNLYDPSKSLLFLDGNAGNGGVPGFNGAQVPPPTHQQPPRHTSSHQSLFGRHPSNNQAGGRPQTLLGPGLLGGDFLLNGGGSDRGMGLGGAPTTATAGVSGPASNPGLFGSGLLAGDEFGCNSVGMNANNVPASPVSGSGVGSSSGPGSRSLSGAESESPLGSDAGNDAATMTPTTATGSSALSGTCSTNGSTDWPSNSSPGSGEGSENKNTANCNCVVGGMVDMLARLNLSKYVPVLAEAEVDMDALRLFGEDDLKDLGFPKGPRIKLLHEVQNLNFSARA